MRIIRAPLKLIKDTGHTYRLEARDAGFSVRSLYLEKSAFPSGIPDYVAVRVIVDESGAMGRFAQFLEDRVEGVDDEDAKITIGQIWSAWAQTHGVGADEREIAGIKRSDVGELFKDRFGAGDLTRGKIDGKSRWCWRNYRIVEGGFTDQARDARTGA